jgi:hypothetical protein
VLNQCSPIGICAGHSCNPTREFVFFNLQISNPLLLLNTAYFIDSPNPAGGFMTGKQLDDRFLDESDLYDLEETDDIGFINTPKNSRRNVRKSIEERLEARQLQQSIRDVFEDDFDL